MCSFGTRCAVIAETGGARLRFTSAASRRTVQGSRRSGAGEIATASKRASRAPSKVSGRGAVWGALNYCW